MSLNTAWCLVRRLSILTFLSMWATSHVFGLSIAIPSDTITGIPFDVVWVRDSTDPTVFSLERQWLRPSTNEFEGGGIFANVSGSEGESLDPQSATLSVSEFGTFIMYGVVIESTATSTFYSSPSFTVLSPSQAAQTVLATTEVVYLGTSFSVPTMSSSATSSSGATTTTTAGSAISTASGHSSHTAAIVGGVVGSLVGLIIVGTATFFLCRFHSKQETNDSKATDSTITQVPPSWLFNAPSNPVNNPSYPTSYAAPPLARGLQTSTSWSTSQAKSSVYPQSLASPSPSSIDFRGSIMAHYYNPVAQPSSVAASSTIDQYDEVVAEAPPGYDQPHFVLTPTPARSP